MKFLCLGYPGHGFSPGPGLVAEYAALGEAMRATGYWSTAVSSAPARRPSSSGSRTGEPTSATARQAADRSPAPTSLSTAQTSTPRLAGPPASGPRATARSKSARPDNCQYHGQDHARLHCLPHRHP